MVDENEGVGFEGGDEATVDLSGVAEDSFEAIPKGLYNVTVDEAEAKTSSTGNPMISLTLLVLDGDYEGRKLFTHVVFSSKTMGMAKRTISRFGLKHLLEGPFKVDQDTADQFVGKNVRAQVDIKKYEGEDTNNVKKILPAEQGGSSDDFLAED